MEKNIRRSDEYIVFGSGPLSVQYSTPDELLAQRVGKEGDSISCRECESARISVRASEKKGSKSHSRISAKAISVREMDDDEW